MLIEIECSNFNNDIDNFEISTGFMLVMKNKYTRTTVICWNFMKTKGYQEGCKGKDVNLQEE
jgi:hypothetical protein